LILSFVLSSWAVVGALALLSSRGVHGNGEDWDPMGFPWNSHGDGSKISHGMGMGIQCMGMGVKTWELEKNAAYCNTE